MGVRLVLGTGPLSRAVLERAGDRFADGTVSLVTDDPHTIEVYADTGRIVPGDPTDPAALRSVTATIRSVIVAEPDSDRQRSIVHLVDSLFPDLPLIVIDDGPDDESDPNRAWLSVADQVLEPAEITGNYVLERTATDPAELAFHLRRLFTKLEPPLGVIAHDNPDPDAIASALGVVRLAEEHGVPAEAGYFGQITHQQNRALVNLLDLDLTGFSDLDALESFGSIALVDHAKPGVNDQLPPETVVDIVIDHHPTYETAPAAHLDLREEVGSTSTLVVEYFDHLSIEPSSKLATALLFGIQTDTDDFVRGASVLDFRAAERLLPVADRDVLARLETPTVSPETLDTIAQAIRHAESQDGIVTSCVGRLRNRDALSQAADRLIAMESAKAVIVYGFDDETIYLSARAGADGIDIGDAVRDAFGQIGSAGGHARMAGGQLPIGMLRSDDASSADELTAAIRTVVDDRFREVVESRRRGPFVDVPGAGDEWSP